MTGFDEATVRRALTTYRPTGAGLTQALTDLGATADEVANTLLAGGYKGEPGCERRCPVARYLGGCFPGVPVRIWQDPEGYLSAEVNDHSCHIAVEPPRPVVEFIRGFDLSSRWADLIEPSEAPA